MVTLRIRCVAFRWTRLVLPADMSPFCSGPTGQATVTVSADATLAQLRTKIQEATGIDAERQQRECTDLRACSQITMLT